MSTQVLTGKVPQWTQGDRLRKAREAAGFSQMDLADATGISRRSISSYESGEAAVKRPYLLSWAVATGVPLAWLEHGGDLAPPPGPGQEPAGNNVVLLPVAA